jgi:hypothetical protein
MHRQNPLPRYHQGTLTISSACLSESHYSVLHFNVYFTHILLISQLKPHIYIYT